MQDFRMINAGLSSNVYADIAVVDRHNVFILVSAIGYDAAVKSFQKEMNQKNSIIMARYGRGMTHGQYESQIKKQGNSDFSHILVSAKDEFDEKSEYLNAYIYYKSDKEFKEMLLNKLNDLTPVPILKEWIDYISICLEDNYCFSECEVKHSYEEKPFSAMKLIVRKTKLIEIISNGLKEGHISINGLNVTTDKMKEIIGLDSYLNTFSEVLATQIQESFTPKFIPGIDPIDRLLTNFDENCYDNDIELFEAQKSVIQASVNNLNKNNVNFVVGEMGSGFMNM